MPPRHQTLPSAQTTSAREAQKSFYCELCAKGYSRMNDYEAHLSSYDHSHKQRLKDMKAMVRDPNASARARKAEAKADGLISIKIADKDGSSSAASGGGGGGGFKKGGFKKSGFKSTMAPVEGVATVVEKPAAPPTEPISTLLRPNTDESDTEEEGYQVYDPRYPTD